jgi:Protein of unknown function (DUF4013)
MERVTDAFIWPARDPAWLTKLLIISLILLIPIVGLINGLGWMLASMDRLRAGEERLAPANLRHIRRGIRLFVVQLVYALVVAAIAAIVYLPGLLLAVSQGHQTNANALVILLSIMLNLIAFGVATLGSLLLTFITPAMVLATDAGGIAGGLRFREVLRRSRANLNNTLIAGLMLIAASFVSSLGAILCVVGVVLTATYALAMQAWVFRSFELGSKASP